MENNKKKEKFLKKKKKIEKSSKKKLSFTEFHWYAAVLRIMITYNVGNLFVNDTDKKYNVRNIIYSKKFYGLQGQYFMAVYYHLIILFSALKWNQLPLNVV